MKYVHGKLFWDENGECGVVKVKVPECVVGLDMLSDWINELQKEYDRIIQTDWQSN